MEAEKLKARRQGDNLLPRLFLMLSPDARLLWYVPINHCPRDRREESRPRFWKGPWRGGREGKHEALETSVDEAGWSSENHSLTVGLLSLNVPQINKDNTHRAIRTMYLHCVE